MPFNPYAIPQVDTRGIRPGPVVSPLLGLREAIAANAAMIRAARIGGGGGGGGRGIATGGVGDPRYGRVVTLPDGTQAWAQGKDAKERDAQELQIRSNYARGILAKDPKYQELTKDITKLSIDGQKDRLRQLNELVPNLSPQLGLDEKQTKKLLTAGINENIAEREKALKNTSFLGSTWEAISLGAQNLYDSIRQIGKSSEEQLAIANAAQERQRQADENNVYRDEMNRRRAEGRSNIGMMLSPTGLGIMAGESLGDLGATLLAQGGGSLIGGALGSLLGPAGTAAGASIGGRLIGAGLGAAAGGALASAPTSDFSVDRQIAASDMSDADKIAAIENNNAGLYGAGLGAAIFGPAQIAGAAVRRFVPAAAQNIAARTANKLARPTGTVAGDALRTVPANMIDASTLGGAFQIAQNYAYNNATGDNIPLTTGLGEAMAAGALLGVPMGLAGARGSVVRKEYWDNKTMPPTRADVDTGTPVSDIQRAGINLDQLMRDVQAGNNSARLLNQMRRGMYQKTSSTTTPMPASVRAPNFGGNDFGPIDTFYSQINRAMDAVPMPVTTSDVSVPLPNFAPRQGAAETGMTAMTKADMSALRREKEPDNFKFTLSNIMASKDPAQVPALLSGLSISKSLSKKQKAFVKEVIDNGNAGADTGRGASSKTAGLDGNGRQAEAAADSANIVDDSAGTAATQGDIAAPTNAVSGEIIDGNPPVEIGGNAGTPAPNPTATATPETVTVGQGIGGPETANREPGGGRAAANAPQPDTGAGGGEPAQRARKRIIVDESNAGKQPDVKNQGQEIEASPESEKAVNQMVEQLELPVKEQLAREQAADVQLAGDIGINPKDIGIETATEPKAEKDTQPTLIKGSLDDWRIALMNKFSTSELNKMAGIRGNDPYKVYHLLAEAQSRLELGKKLTKSQDKFLKNLEAAGAPAWKPEKGITDTAIANAEQAWANNMDVTPEQMLEKTPDKSLEKSVNNPECGV